MEDLLGIKNINSHSELDSKSINLMDNKELALIDSGSESGMTGGKCVNPLSLRERARVRGQLLTLPDKEIAERVRNDMGKSVVTPPEFLSSQSSLRNSTLPVQGERKFAKAGFTLAGATHIGLPPIIAKAGFTLAEVLITLGIIGVVAAMTIPNLMSKITGIQYRSRLKKSVSTLSQAARLNKANYGWDFAGINMKCNDIVDGRSYGTHHPESASSMCALLNGSLSTKTQVKSEYPFSGTFVGIVNKTAYNIYLMPDGTAVGFRGAVMANRCELPVGSVLTDAKAQLDGCRGFIDVNGPALPNLEVKCSIGTTSTDITKDCIVKDKDIKDIYPVVFYNDIVGPATNATRYVLGTTK